MTDQDKKKNNTTRCPSCTVEVDEDCKTFPFCSKRCKDADLSKWFSGQYVISRPLDQSDLDEV